MAHAQLTIHGEVRCGDVPPRHASHPLVAGRTYCTLPPRLLRAIVREVGEARFDAELLKLEFDLSEIVAGQCDGVGFANGSLISYTRLEAPPQFQIPDRFAAQWKMTTAELRKLERDATERLDRFARPLRGYVGWLLTNPVFVREHDDLFTRHRRRIRQNGIPQPIMTSGKPGECFRKCRNGVGWINEVRTFCQRWRLQSLAGPNLPCPLAPQIPCIRPDVPTIMGSTAALIPDTFPVSGTGAVAEAMQDGAHGGAKPEHLADWLHIIAKDNTAKNAIGRFARLFRLQHFWRVLHNRHSAVLQRRSGRLIMAFADYLNVSDESIRKDLRWIKQRLGSEWHLRSDPPASSEV